MNQRLLTLALATFLAQPAIADQHGTGSLKVDVTGRGEVQSLPDIAMINASLVRQGPQSADLLEAVSTTMTEVLEVLQQQGIASEDIQAGQLRIHQRWNRQQGRNEPDGYEAQRPLTVTVRSIEDYPRIIDALSAAGVNTVAGVSFDFKDRQQLGDQALELATADATRKAALLGKALGAPNCQPAHVTVGPRHIPMPRMEMAAMKASDQVYNPGSQVISAEVTATFQCRKSR